MRGSLGRGRGPPMLRRSALVMRALAASPYCQPGGGRVSSQRAASLLCLHASLGGVIRFGGCGGAPMPWAPALGGPPPRVAFRCASTVARKRGASPKRGATCRGKGAETAKQVSAGSADRSAVAPTKGRLQTEVDDDEEAVLDDDEGQEMDWSKSSALDEDIEALTQGDVDGYGGGLGEDVDDSGGDGGGGFLRERRASRRRRGEVLGGDELEEGEPLQPRRSGSPPDDEVDDAAEEEAAGARCRDGLDKQRRDGAAGADGKAVVDAAEEGESKLLVDRFPEYAAEYDPANPVKVHEVHVDSGKVVVWNCAECATPWRCGVFVRCILRTRCPQCERIRCPTLKEKCPEVVPLWDPSLNDPCVDPAILPHTSSLKGYWRCPTCQDSFQARVKDMATRKVSCTRCAMAASHAGMQDRDVFMREWHPFKNGDRLPEQVKPTDKTKVWWLCSSCGNEWQATMHSRLSASQRVRGKYCPACSATATGPRE